MRSSQQTSSATSMAATTSIPRRPVIPAPYSQGADDALSLFRRAHRTVPRYRAYPPNE